MILEACNSLYWGDALILRAVPSDIALLAALTACNSVTANLLTGRLPMMVSLSAGLSLAIWSRDIAADISFDCG